jgi:hypothetical protein
MPPRALILLFLSLKLKVSGWDLKVYFLLYLPFRLVGAAKNASWLRSWVQIPPGPLFTVVQLRYCFELDLSAGGDVEISEVFFDLLAGPEGFCQKNFTIKTQCN